MIRRTKRPAAPVSMRRTIAALITSVACAVAIAAAQAPPDTPEALARQLEGRFDVLPLTDGIALRPLASGSGVRSIEITDIIAIDGVPATGAELRARLGADADLVLRISYLDPEARRRLLEPAAAAGPAPAASVPAGTAPAEPSAPPALPAPPARPEPPGRPPERARTSDERVRIAGSVTIDEDELIQGDVVAVGGSVRVFGEVRGEVVAVGGNVELGPNAVVARDVTVVGGSLQRAPTARVGGRVNEVSIGAIDLSQLRWPSLGGPRRRAMGSAFSLVSTIARVAVLCLLVTLVMLLGRQHVERIGARAAAEPVKAGAIGLLSQLLFLPVFIVTVVVLIVTIVGIPLLVLLPFAVLALGLVALVGYTSIAHRAGRVVTARLPWAGQGPYATAVAGVLLLALPALLARLVGLAGGVLYPLSLALTVAGFLVEYLAWTVGFGAVALLRFSRPPAPPLVSPAGDAPPPRYDAPLTDNP
jgi:hypothetical protein